MEREKIPLLLGTSEGKINKKEGVKNRCKKKRKNKKLRRSNALSQSQKLVSLSLDRQKSDPKTIELLPKQSFSASPSSNPSMTSQFFPWDIEKLILEKMDYEDLYGLLVSNEKYQPLLNDVSFWANKAYFDFGFSKTLFRITKLHPWERYLEIFTLWGNVAPGSEKFISIDEAIDRALREDDPKLLDYFLKHKSFVGDEEAIIIKQQARTNKFETLKYLIEKAEYDFDRNILIMIGLNGAVEGNQPEVILKLIKLLDNPDGTEIIIILDEAKGTPFLDMMYHELKHTLHTEYQTSNCRSKEYYLKRLNDLGLKENFIKEFKL